ncbi:Hypothetical predicted protein [Mytilus galloprovincialis]|uniref:Reverse transcriptase domain-containing protein n=1 Tax=Mytilus galloprovincialis TaxID=29158 RepID=A0A8B6EPA3_MYTGA|nr:Hypothetical predicted protein [Mytilus galloprovincialis]
MIHRLKKNTLLAKCDVKSAFRLLRLSPGDFDLMGFKFENQYFFDKCLPMGASISSALFESFSTALHWVVQQQSKNDNILHYLDDFLFGGEAQTSQCHDTLKCFQDSCKLWGVPLAEGKTVEPTEVLIFLDATEINDYIELLLDNGQTIHVPVAVSEITFKQLKPDKIKDYAHYSLEVGPTFRYFLNLCKGTVSPTP